MKSITWLPAIALSVLLSACGGGDAQHETFGEPALSVLRAQPHAMTAAANAVSSTEQLLDFAEAVYPSYFPGHKSTASSYPFAYRYYPETGIYLGVVVNSGTPAALQSVYVMGGPFGNTPALVGPMTNYLVSIKGSISGNVSASGLALTLTTESVPGGATRSETLSVPYASSFEFGTLVPVGAHYTVAVQSQPSGGAGAPVCSVSGGDGVAPANSAPAVTVSCGQGYTVGGSISWTSPPAIPGQGAGPVLASGDLIATPALGAAGFALSPAVDAGTTYNVAVQADPLGYHCVVTNGSGIVTTAVADVKVSCVATFDGSTTASVADGGTTTANGYTLDLIIKDFSVLKFTVDQIRNEFFATYPVMAATFNPSAPRQVTVIVDPNPAYADAAYTLGTTITISSAWLKQNPMDIDVVVHEAFHVVQAYPSNAPTPWWITEGLADYARDRYGLWNSISGWSMGMPGANSSYTDGYGTTARFFKWVEANYGAMAVALDNDMRAGVYSASFWPNHTGHTVDELWAEYVQFPQRGL